MRIMWNSPRSSHLLVDSLPGAIGRPADHGRNNRHDQQDRCDLAEHLPRMRPPNSPRGLSGTHQRTTPNVESTNGLKGTTMRKLPNHVCPRCLGGIPNNEDRGTYPGALSRTDNLTEICSECGVLEAIEDQRGLGWGGALPQTQWAINSPFMGKDSSNLAYGR